MCSREMPCCPEILNERMQLVADDLRLLMVLCLDQEDASTSYFASEFTTCSYILTLPFSVFSSSWHVVRTQTNRAIKA